MADGGQQLGFNFAVQDEASRPIGRIEKAYLGLMSTWNKVTNKVKGAMKAMSDRFSDVSKGAEKAGKATKEQSGKFAELRTAVNTNVVGLDKLGISWDRIIKGLTALSIGAVVVGVIAFFKKAFDAALKFRREMALLNEQYALNAMQAREVSRTIVTLAGRAGKTRQEITQLAGSLLELGLVPGVVDGLGISFKELTKVTLDLSAATGVSSETAAEFADQLIRINRVPAQGIRGIGAAIKFIADESRISADALIGLNKNLEPLFAMLSDQSEKARTDFTLNMLGLGGALSNIGIDAGKVTGQFAEMLDRTSSQGAEAIGQLSNFTRVGTEQLREMIKTDPSAIFDAIAKRASKLDPTTLDLYAKALEGIGLDRADLRRLREFGQTSKTTFGERAAAVAKAAAKEEDLAKKGEARQTKLDKLLSRFNRMWDDMMLDIGGPLLDILVPLLEKFVRPLIKEFTGFLKKVDWKAFAKGADSTVRSMTTVFMGLGRFIGSIFGTVGGIIGKTFGVAAIAVEAFIKLFKGEFGGAARLFGEMFKGMGSVIFDVFTTLPRAAFAAFGLNFDEWLNDTLGKLKGWGKIAIKAVAGFLTWVKDGFMKVGMVMISPFRIAADFIMEQVDKLLSWLGKEIAPKVARIPVIGSALAESLLGLGEAAQARIDVREHEASTRKKAGQVSSVVGQAARTAEVTQPAIQVSGQGIPDRMRTNSPEQEDLLRKNNTLLEGIFNNQRLAGGGGRSSKHSAILANSGNR